MKEEGSGAYVHVVDYFHAAIFAQFLRYFEPPSRGLVANYLERVRIP